MKQALSGIKVLDFSQLLQGPFATQMLGDLGADVIKIERYKSGDIYRGMTFFNKWIAGDESPCFMAWNRNKRSIALNLKNKKAIDIIYKLVEESDIVMENFRPGVMDRFGFGYEDFKKINPGIIYCSSTGWGTSGPYVTRPGQDLLIQSMSGAIMTSGKKSDGPVAIGTALCDQINALNSVYAILAALYYREKTGKGQEITSNLLSSAITFQMQDFFTIMNMNTRFERPESGIGHPGNPAPFGTYQTSDGYIAIAMSPWEKIIEVTGDESLMEYNDPQILYDKRDEIYYRLQAIFIRRTTDEWMEALLELDIWASPVQKQEDVPDDPQVKHNNTFVEIEHPKAGKLKVTDVPFSMSETPGKITRPSPMIGEHGPEILQEIGYSETEIKQLIQDEIMSVEQVKEEQ